MNCYLRNIIFWVGSDSPLYYIARNSFIMLKRHKDFLSILYLVLVVRMNIMAKISIKETLHYTFRGIMDGVSGRLETMSFCAEGI